MRTRIIALVLGLVVCVLWAQETTGPNPFGKTVQIVRPGMNLSNSLWSASNNSEIEIEPGFYGVPRLGQWAAGVSAHSIPFYNKSNVTIKGYGAVLTNSNPGVTGICLAISNCSNIKVYGLTIDGGGVVNSNSVSEAASIQIGGQTSDILIKDCRFINDHHGITRGGPPFSATNLWWVNNTFYGGGDTGFPGTGGSGVDGAAISCFGHNSGATGNYIEGWARGIEVEGTVLYRGVLIQNNIIKNTRGDAVIFILSGVASNVVVSGNHIYNDPGVANLDGILLVDCVHCLADGNTVMGTQMGIRVVASSINVFGTLVANNTIEKINVDGIRLDSNTSFVSRGCTIMDNVVNGIGRWAIAVAGNDNLVHGNFVMNAATNATEGAINVNPFGSPGSCCTNNVIANNTIIDTQAAATTDWGIEIESGVTNTAVWNNYIRRMVTASISDSGVGTAKGARPVLEGTATLSSGLATVNTVLVNANSRIMLTPRATANAVNAVGVTNVVNGTSFQIRSTSNTDGNAIHWTMFEPQ